VCQCSTSPSPLAALLGFLRSCYGPLLSSNRTVKARFWPWLDPFFWRKSENPFKVFPPRSVAAHGFSPCGTISVSEAGSYLRLIDWVYHSTLGLRVIQKKRRLAL